MQRLERDKVVHRPRENGYLFRADDADNLEEGMERIVSDLSMLMEMGTSSYELVVSEHSSARNLETLLAFAERRE